MQTKQSPHGAGQDANSNADSIAVSVFTSSGALSKSFALTAGGTIEKKPAAQLFDGRYERKTLPFAQLPELMDSLTHRQALSFGIAQQEAAAITTKGKEQPPTSIARSRDHFAWPAGPGVMMLDFDAPGLSQAECGAALATICPELAESAWFVRGSVSAGVHRADELPGDPKSWHLYVLVENTADILRAGQVLFDRLWLAEHGKIELSKAGSFLVRGLIDASVWQPERLDFAGKPVLSGEGLTFTPPRVELNDGPTLDTKAALPDLTAEEKGIIRNKIATAKAQRQDEADALRHAFTARIADDRALKGACRDDFFAGMVTAFDAERATLPGDYPLKFDKLGTVTVREVLADPAKFHEQPLLDPLTGEPGKTKCYVNPDGRVWVHTFAHGGGRWRLVDNPHAGFAGALTPVDGEGKRRLLAPSTCAERMVPRICDKIAYDAAGALWAVWKGTHWNLEPSGVESRKLLADLLDVGTAPKGWKPALLTDITTVLEARQLLPMPARAPGLLSFANGVLDLNTGALNPHNPDTGCTWALPWHYDPDARCKAVTGWLVDATDKPTAHFLLCWLAALLRGVELQKFLFLHGPGGTGKSTFIRLAQALVGADNCHTSSLPQIEGNRFELAGLVGKALLVIPDAGKYTGKVDVLKSITGGDPLRCERKYTQPFSFTYPGQVVIASNQPLASTDHTSGLERRRMVVEFTKRVTPEQRADWVSRGGETEVLHSEIPGLINLLRHFDANEIHAAMEHPPKSVAEANREHERDANPVAAWAAQWLEFTPGAVAQVGGMTELRDPTDGRKRFERADVFLYPSYLTHCLQSNRKPVALNVFTRTLVDHAQTHGHDVTKHRAGGTGRAVLTGLRLRVPG